MPLISIIVPYYNRAHCLPALIESVRAQTHSHWELIIIDDCSGDSEQAVEIIREAADSRIIYQRHEKNLNGARARNTGIDISRGQYIAFLDSDDIWLPTKLAAQLEQLMLCEQPDNTILYGALEKSYQDESKPAQVLPHRPKGADESVSDYLFANKGLMQTSTFFLTRTLADKIRFNPELPRHQDYDFVLRAERLKVRFEFTPQVLCQWICLQGDGNIAKKGGGLDFAIRWFSEYQPYMTSSGAFAYLSRQMFYCAVKSKSPFKYYHYVLKKVGLMSFFGVLLANIRLIINK